MGADSNRMRAVAYAAVREIRCVHQGHDGWRLNVSITHVGQSNGESAAISGRPGTVLHGGR